MWPSWYNLAWFAVGFFAGCLFVAKVLSYKIEDMQNQIDETWTPERFADVMARMEEVRNGN